MSRLLVSRATDIGKVRDHNEDAEDYRRIKHRSGDYELLIVADGMGGHSRGEVASALAISTVLEFLGYGAWNSPPEGLERAFLLANERVHAGGGDMGTTLTAILINSETMEYWVANVGDSRAYLVQRDTFEPLTKDHSEIAARVDAGQLTREEAQTAKGRNVLLRAIGPDARVSVDVDGPRVLHPGERLMLCSDGLHGMIPERELGLMTWQTPLDADAAGRLVAAANAAGGRDNITAIIAAMEDDAPTVFVPPLAAASGLFGRIPLQAVAAVIGLALFGGAVAAALALSMNGAGGSSAGSTTPTVTSSPTSVPTRLTPTATPTPAAPTATPPPVTPTATPVTLGVTTTPVTPGVTTTPVTPSVTTTPITPSVTTTSVTPSVTTTAVTPSVTTTPVTPSVTTTAVTPSVTTTPVTPGVTTTAVTPANRMVPIGRTRYQALNRRVRSRADLVGMAVDQDRTLLALATNWGQER